MSSVPITVSGDLMSPPMSLYGAVELGGTKTDVAFGTSPDDISEPVRIPTTTPEETLGEVLTVLATESVDAVGIASFGPLTLDPTSADFGTMLATPKLGWSGTPIYLRILDGVSVPVALDTDVNGAAMGEGRWGAAQGMRDYVYLTVGTGIGAGIVINGVTLSGERHPETGHMRVQRLEGDSFPGTCEFHFDCLEGLAAGPALEGRFGHPENFAGNGAVLDLVCGYLAQGLTNLVYTVAPERIIVGGGVSALPGFHTRLRTMLGTTLGGYPLDPDLDLLVSAPGLGPLSGLAGALVLAAGAG